jgi:hypothetical protein
MVGPPSFVTAAQSMPKPNPLQPIARVVAADPRLAAWNARRQHESELMQALLQVLPRPLAAHVWVSEAVPPTLELGTATGAVAAVLRQRGPDVLAALAQKGWKFTGIRVRVQPRIAPKASEKTLSHQWDNRAKRPLAALEAGLPQGPLKAALQRLLRGR